MDLILKAHLEKKAFVKELINQEHKPLWQIGKMSKDGSPYVELDKCTYIFGLIGLNECVKYLIVNNLILTIILLLLVVSLIIFTIVLIVKPDAFCCRGCFCWKKEYNDGNFWNIGRLNDDIFIEGEGPKYSIV